MVVGEKRVQGTRGKSYKGYKGYKGYKVQLKWVSFEGALTLNSMGSPWLR